MSHLLFSKTIDGAPPSHVVLRSTSRRLAALKSVPKIIGAAEMTEVADIRDTRKTTRKRDNGIESLPRPIAPFMKEIEVELAAQLHNLERQWDQRLFSESEYRRRRYELFRNSMQGFSSVFSTYRLFLSSIEEESDAFISYLSQQLAAVSSSSSLKIKEFKANVADVGLLRMSWEREKEQLVEQIAAQNRILEELKSNSLEAAVRERAALPDVRRQLQEMHLRCTMLSDENATLKGEVTRLKRLTDSLSLETFSESLQSAQIQLRDTRDQLQSKEEALCLEHEAAEDLARDLKKVAEVLHRHTRRPLDKNEVRLTRRGFDVLFTSDS